MHREITKQMCNSPAEQYTVAMTRPDLWESTLPQWLRGASHLYDETGDRLSDHFEQLRRLLTRLQAEAGDQQLRRPGHEAAGRLQGQQHQHRQPVEAVVDGGAGKGPAAAGTNFSIPLTAGKLRVQF